MLPKTFVNVCKHKVKYKFCYKPVGENCTAVTLTSGLWCLELMSPSFTPGRLIAVLSSSA